MPVTSLSRRAALAMVCTATLGSSACDRAADALARLRGPDSSPPDSLPQLLNDSLPFDYPPGLYLQLIDDSVTLRLHIDAFGQPVPESTKVERGAQYALFDSAAVEGSRELRFRPAKRKGKAMAYTVLFPIQFRVPPAPTPAAPVDTGRR